MLQTGCTWLIGEDPQPRVFGQFRLHRLQHVFVLQVEPVSDFMDGADVIAERRWQLDLCRRTAETAH